MRPQAQPRWAWLLRHVLLLLLLLLQCTGTGNAGHGQCTRTWP